MQFVNTQEQNAIIAAAALGKSIKVKAFAGAAKTTTLVLASREIMHECLYLAYNKKMQLEAKEKFPSHVEVRTVHSMAYQAKGIEMSHKLKRPGGRYQNVCGTASEIARHFKVFDIPLKNGKKILAQSIGKVIKDTVGSFENSAHDRLGKQHINLGRCRKYVLAGLITQDYLEKLVLPKAQKLWELRTDMTSQILATHETYLKLYQLSKPQLGYPTVFLDEAQDSNDCVLDIVLSQNTQVIIVGDDFQSIYQWRGSINALNKVNFPEYHLTTSWRFGQTAADMANLILEQTVDGIDVRGNPKATTELFTDPSHIPFPFTKIFRSNAELLIEAVDLIGRGIDVHIEVDFKDLLLAFASGEALYENCLKDVKHDLFLGCEDWKDAEIEGQANGEIARIVKMIENGSYRGIVSALERYVHPENPMATYITAHKSKGLEWDNVIIAQDFPVSFKEGAWVLDDQERNLLYVVHTRAKKRLCVGSIIAEIAYSGRASAGVGVTMEKVMQGHSGGFITESFADIVERNMVGFGHRPWDDVTNLADYALGPIEDGLGEHFDMAMHLPK